MLGRLEAVVALCKGGLCHTHPSRWQQNGALSTSSLCAINRARVWREQKVVSVLRGKHGLFPGVLLGDVAVRQPWFTPELPQSWSPLTAAFYFQSEEGSDPAVSSRKTSQSWLVTTKTPSAAYWGLNRCSFSFCDSFPRLISQHPYYLFLSSGLQFWGTISVLQTWPAIFFLLWSFRKKKKKINHPFFHCFSKWGATSHCYLLPASIAPFLLWHLQFLWCFLFPHWGSCLFLFIFFLISKVLFLVFLLKSLNPAPWGVK